MDASNFAETIRADLAKEGLSKDQLRIVDSIRDYCCSIGRPEWEESDQRIAKCLLLTTPPTILLRREIDHRLHSEGLIPLVLRDFPEEDVELLNEPLTFIRHLVFHEIAHITRRQLHLKMSHDEMERDCDAWAFAKIKEPIQAPQQQRP